MRPNQDNLIFTKEWETDRSLAGLCYYGQCLRTALGVWIENLSFKSNFSGGGKEL